MTMIGIDPHKQPTQRLRSTATNTLSTSSRLPRRLVGFGLRAIGIAALLFAFTMLFEDGFLELAPGRLVIAAASLIVGLCVFASADILLSATGRISGLAMLIVGTGMLLIGPTFAIVASAATAAAVLIAVGAVVVGLMLLVAGIGVLTGT